MRGDDFLDFEHIGGGAHERERDHVHAVLQTELQIVAVFVGQRRNGERGAGKIDALMLAEQYRR